MSSMRASSLVDAWGVVVHDGGLGMGLVVWGVSFEALGVQEAVLGPLESVAQMLSTGWSTTARSTTTRVGEAGRVQGVVQGLQGLERVCR